MSWFLMPDPGTTDSAHILEIVKKSRMSVFSSVIVQIVSSVLYTVVLSFDLTFYIDSFRGYVRLLVSSVDYFCRNLLSFPTLKFFLI
nr:hypothetical protein [Leptospira alstonii]